MGKFKGVTILLVLSLLILTNNSFGENHELIEDVQSDVMYIFDQEEGEEVATGYIIEFVDHPVVQEELKRQAEELDRKRAYSQKSGLYKNTVGPLVKYYQESRSNSQVKNYKNKLEKVHKEVLEDTTGDESIIGAFVFISGRATEEAPIIQQEYTRVFNGVHADLTPEQLISLKNDERIKSIVPNQIYKIDLQDSVPLIGASELHQQGITGEGIKIGIIDTGVNYSHPDLGGCLGSNCKVKESYDIKQDSVGDADNVGHGTHVAGIIAADGQVTGVAPDAELYAFKVCNFFGCTTDDILEAIEISSDLNQDGDFSDRLDVISLSLGGIGHPDDPLSTAIDQAVDLGVVAVISAGNSGHNPYTVRSPGTARKAITVGATDKNDDVAEFSSRGPTILDTFKPDVSAPGVSITSTVSGGTWNDPDQDGYATFSGTSMSAPHVSGLVALVKQQNPDLTPSQIKSAITTTAEDIITVPVTDIIPYSVNETNQTNSTVPNEPVETTPNVLDLGSGRINAGRAINPGLVIEPSHLSFTSNDASSSITLPFTLNVEDVDPTNSPEILLSATVKILDESLQAEVFIESGRQGVISLSSKNGGLIEEGIHSGLITFEADDSSEYRIPFIIRLDSTPPVISNVQSSSLLVGNQAIRFVEWFTDEITTGQVYYRKQGSNTYIVADSDLISQAHSVPLLDLEQGIYEYYISSKNNANLITETPIGAFQNLLNSQTIPNGNYQRLNSAPLTKITSNGPTDFNRNGRNEIILQPHLGNNFESQLQIHEYANQQFELKYEQNLNPDQPTAAFFYRVGDYGDIDQDGLLDYAVYGKLGTPFFFSIYEQSGQNEFPSQEIFRTEPGGAWPQNFDYTFVDDDSDLDIAIVTGYGYQIEPKITVYESTGDNSISHSFDYFLPENPSILQGSDVAEDMDRDGKNEILYAGISSKLRPEVRDSFVTIAEYNEANSMEVVWRHEFLEGDLINMNIVEYLGDTDGDGKKEFIVGGLKPQSQITTLMPTIYYLFENNGPDSYEIVWSIAISRPFFRDTSVAGADVNADGLKDIIINSAYDTYVFENIGDNNFVPKIIPSTETTRHILVADLNNNGVDEIIVGSGRYETPVLIPENCRVVGDEDGNGLSDCADSSVCIESTICNLDGTNTCQSGQCLPIQIPEEPPVDPTNGTGTLIVETTPSGELIRIDNTIFLGSQDQKTITLEEGNHILDVVKEGYHWIMGYSFLINSGKTTTLQINLTSVTEPVPTDPGIIIVTPPEEYPEDPEDPTLPPGNETQPPEEEFPEEPPEDPGTPPGNETGNETQPPEEDPEPLPYTCTDTDGGKNIDEKGTITYTNANGEFTATDECVTAITIREFWCDGFNGESYFDECPGSCSNGACIEGERPEDETPTCTDTDGGEVYDVRGTITATATDGSVFSRTDWCSTSWNLIEHVCTTENDAGWKYISKFCAAGCSNGVISCT